MMLALDMGRTLEELCCSMTSTEFEMWRALYRQKPWGDKRGDLQAAIVAQAVAHYSGNPADIDDFLLKFKIDAPEAHTEEPDPMKYFKN